jgi:hypothetical protein
LKNHTAYVHNANQVPKSIRRVGQLHGLIKPPSTKNSTAKQRLTEQNNPGAASVSAQAATNDKGPYNRRTIPKEWEQQLDVLFQQKEFAVVIRGLEGTLASLKELQTPIPREKKVAMLPPGIPAYIKDGLLWLRQAGFIQVLEQACERARKKMRAEAEEAFPLSVPKEHTKEVETGSLEDDFTLFPYTSSSSSYQPLSTGNIPEHFEIHHLDSGGQSSSSNVDSGHRVSGKSGLTEAKQAVLGTYANLECQECRKQKKRCDMSLPSCKHPLHRYENTLSTLCYLRVRNR